MPENTVKVDRTTHFGNPYRVNSAVSRKLAVALFRHGLKSALKGKSRYLALCGIARTLPELRGKNLACWCPLDKPCHADVLLELANKDTE